jgi:hypothetical protein
MKLKGGRHFGDVEVAGSPLLTDVNEAKKSGLIWFRIGCSSGRGEGGVL